MERRFILIVDSCWTERKLPRPDYFRSREIRSCENPGDLVGRVQDLVQTLDETQPKFTGIDVAVARLGELLADRDILIVIDDVWDGAHLKPFMKGGPRCARLITTRNLDTLPANAKDAAVDAMQPEEATELLRKGLPPGNETELCKLAGRLGEWPLLLTLANGQLRDRVQHAKQPISGALAYVNRGEREMPGGPQNYA